MDASKFSDNGQGTKRKVSRFSSFYNFLFTNHNRSLVNHDLIFSDSRMVPLFVSSDRSSYYDQKVVCVSSSLLKCLKDSRKGKSTCRFCVAGLYFRVRCGLFGTSWNPKRRETKMRQKKNLVVLLMVCLWRNLDLPSIQKHNYKPNFPE